MICTKCNTEKPLFDFHKRKDTKLGVRKNCKVCVNATTAKSFSKIKDVKSSYDKERYSAIKEKRKSQVSLWQKNNKDKVNAIVAKNRASKIQRTPSWLDKYDDIVINFIYKTAKDIGDIMNMNFDVDHIVPLNGERVSGLHCPDNLQILPASVNRSKSNKWEA